MQRTIFYLLILCFSYNLFSQKEANTWYFGHQAGIDFNSGSPVALLDAPFAPTSFRGSGASISTSTGELLFFTDGFTVFNKNRELLLNGEDIGGGVDSTQPAIIVPKPGDANIYYIFTTYYNPISDGLRYTEVDMRLDGGLGGVTSNKGVLLVPNMNNKLTAVKSTSFNGYWILAHKWNSNKFVVYKVTSAGIDFTPDEYAVGPIINGNVENAEGQLKLAANGLKLAMASEGDMNEVQLLDFNPSTGEMSNPVTIVDEDADTSIYGVEFSPNGKLLYVSGSENGVYQYNLEAGSVSDIMNSRLKLSVFNHHYASLQLAPDGKIYVAKDGYEHIDYVTNPDVLGVGCNYRYHLGGFYLEGRRSTKGFPQFIQSYFYVGFTAEDVCFGDATQFTANISEAYDSINWDFGDGNIATVENPTHTFLSPGVYTVTLTVTSGAETSVETNEVIIYAIPTAMQPSNLLICDTDNDGFYNFDLTTQNTTILNGQSTDDFRVDYYASATDYTNGNPITDYTNYQNTTAYQSQNIIASVSNIDNGDCKAITQFDIQVFESPKPAVNSTIPNLSDCDNTSVGSDIDGRILFDLTDRETVILNGQSTTDFEVAYFLDATFTMQIPLAEITAFENSISPQTIYTRVTNRNNTTCVGDTSFVLEVNELPTLASVVSLRQCDTDIDGFSFFNLTEVNEEIINNSTDYTITYFETEIQAQSNNTPITNFTTYGNQTVSTDTVWARVENTSGCFRTSQINLFVSTTQIPLTYTKEFFECDDGADNTDGIATFDFSQVTNEIIAIFPPGQQLIIKYYQSEADALAEINAIPDADISNYQNTTSPNNQDIYIRVDSAVDNDCLGLGHHITLYVEAQPIANSVTITPECDNDRDGLFSFDTSNIETTIIGSQTGVLVSYVDENGVALPSPLPNPFTTASQTITARITNSSSQDSDGQCFDETSIDFIVNTVPIANLISPQEMCDDDTDGIVSFDTTNIENTILGLQTGMVVTYVDENGTALPSPLPNPFTTASQTITVRVENPLYVVCFEETTVEFIVREKPVVKVSPEDIICMTNAPSKDISVENPNSNYTYTWTDENGAQIGTGETININKGGLYSVIATSQYNCISEKDEINVIESQIATITQNDIEIIDDSDNNSIVINTANLGLGNYEYSLLDENLLIVYDYQDSSTFENLIGGIYTIQIRDKNGCGKVQEEVSVISYPKFFTPNNDGKNDIWTIKGFNATFYPSSGIYIYNRFGNIITELSPEKPTWNGLYKGKPVPSNTYWFSAQLIDRNGNLKTRKGYFSLLRK